MPPAPGAAAHGRRSRWRWPCRASGDPARPQAPHPAQPRWPLRRQTQGRGMGRGGQGETLRDAPSRWPVSSTATTLGIRQARGAQQDSRNKTSATRQAQQHRRDKAGATRQPQQDKRNKTSATTQAQQHRRNKAVATTQSVQQDGRNNAGATRQPQQRKQQGRRNNAVVTRRPQQRRSNKTGATRRNKTAATTQAQQDSRNSAGATRQPQQRRRNKTAATAQAQQGSAFDSAQTLARVGGGPLGKLE